MAPVTLFQSPQRFFHCGWEAHRPPLTLLADPNELFPCSRRLGNPAAPEPWALLELHLGTCLSCHHTVSPQHICSHPQFWWSFKQSWSSQRAAVLCLNTFFYFLRTCVVSTHRRWVILPGDKWESRVLSFEHNLINFEFFHQVNQCISQGSPEKQIGCVQRSWDEGRDSL